MKNITLIAVIGSNNAFKDEGCPLHTRHTDYCAYFKNLTLEHNIVISEHTYDALPDKSPPYPCRDVYIISQGELNTDSGSCRTQIVPTLADAIAIACASDKKTFILADHDLYMNMYLNHQDDIDQILVATVDELYGNDKQWEPLSPLEWQPMTIEQKAGGRHTPGYEIVRYRNNPAV